MLAIAVPVGAGAAEPAYCVRPVNVVAADVTADLERKLRSLEPLPTTPDSFDLSIGARYPVAWHAHTVEGRDGLKQNHSLYWSFSENYELVGPRDFLGAGYPVTVGRDGRSFLLGGVYEKFDSGKRLFRNILLQQVDGGVITEVESDLQKQLGDTRLVAWSDLLNGFVLSSIQWREDRAGDASGDERTFLLRGDTLAKLPSAEQSLLVVTDLPRLGVTALLGYGSLAIVTPQLEKTAVAALSRGHFGRFEALYETRDEGWLYADGDDYDNAVHVERVDGKWRATDIVRIEPIEDSNEGWLGRFVRWVLSPMPDQMKHDEHFKVMKTGTCQRFSTAIKRMLFCGDGPFTTDIRRELRAGEMIPVAGGAGGLKTFLGDADSLGLALFLGADRGLYGYDGEHVERIADADFVIATVNDLPKLGRTLVVSPNAMFEVRAKGHGHELVKLAGLGDRALFHSPLLAAPDGNAVLAFAQDGVYQLKDGALTVVWSSAEHGSVDPYGGTPPTDVAGWGGILFTTHLGKEIQFHLLRPCSESTGSFHNR